jgi:hypothetical protein
LALNPWSIRVSLFGKLAAHKLIVLLFTKPGRPPECRPFEEPTDGLPPIWKLCP